MCNQTLDSPPSTHAGAMEQPPTKEPGLKNSRPPSPCYQTQQGTAAIHPSNLCERRGGVAARGAGSHSSAPIPCAKPRANIPTRRSFTRHEEDEDEDDDTDASYETYSISPPLSPKTIVHPRTLRNQRNYQLTISYQHPSLRRRTGWKPSLKEELLRRTSIEAAAMGHAEPRSAHTSHSTDANPTTTTTTAATATITTSSDLPSEDATNTPQPQQQQQQQQRRRRGSTLLHPSSPIATHAVPVSSSSSSTVTEANPLPTATNAPDTPPPSPCPPFFPQYVLMPPRKGSSLLHPSPPPSAMPTSQFKTVLSFPPRKTWGDGGGGGGGSSSITGGFNGPLSPALSTSSSSGDAGGAVAQDEVVMGGSGGRGRQQQQQQRKERRASVVHSCFSEAETETEGETEGEEGFSGGRSRKRGLTIRPKGN